MSAGVGPDPPSARAGWMPVARAAGEPVAEAGIPPPAPRAWQVTSSPLLSRSVWIWAVGWVLCLHLLVKVRGWGNGHILEGAVQCRDQASWTFTSFLVTFVLLIHGADVITCWTDWCLGNPVSGSHGPFLLNPSG